MSPRRACLLFLAATALVSSRADAADCAPPSGLSSCLDSDNLWHRAGSSQFIGVGGTALVEPSRFSFGLMASYQKRPVVLRLPSSDPGGTDAYAVDDQLNASFLWALGLTRGVELDVVMPVTLYQTGVGESPLTEQDPSPLVRSTIRDLRVGATFGLLERPAGYITAGPGLASRIDLTLPTGDTRIFAGGRGAGLAPSFSFDYRVGRFLFGVEAGARLRLPVELSGARIGSQAFEAAGVSLDVLSGERLSVSAEAFSVQALGPEYAVSRGASGAATLVGGRAPHAPAEWIASVRSAPLRGGEVSFHLGGGTSIPLSTNDVTQPAFRLVAGLRYAPLTRDSDGDGVPDRDDKCPDAPEDRDGFQDADGCPDPDNDADGVPDRQDACRDEGGPDVLLSGPSRGCPDADHDGIADKLDKCPDQPETMNGFQDEDGCPDRRPDRDADGVDDDVDKCPDEGGPSVLREGPYRGCPDTDHDGVPDKLDRCPNEPDTIDGVKGKDGCPDPDRDHDGVPNAIDKCPAVPETINGVQDDDGCPEPGASDLVALKGLDLVLASPLRFARGEAKVTPAIAAGLRMALQKARGVGDFGQLIVQTYGDGPAPAARQEALASRRADAVRAALLGMGLRAEQVVAAVGDVGAKRPPGAPHAELQITRRAK